MAEYPDKLETSQIPATNVEQEQKKKKFDLGEYKPFTYENEIIKPYHASFLNRTANNANKKFSFDAVFANAKRGLTLEDQDREAREGIQQSQAAAAHQALISSLFNRADALAKTNVPLDDKAYRAAMDAFRSEWDNAPQAPGLPDLKNPNIAQALFALLGGVMNPTHSMDILSTPFVHNLQEQQKQFALDNRDFEIDQANHQREMQMLSGLADDELKIALNNQSMAAKSLEQQYDAVQDQIRNEITSYGQNQMFARSLWTDLNNARGSVAGIKAGIAALEGSGGVELPANWEKVRADLIAEAEREESTKNDAQKWQKNETLIQGYMAKIGDPNRVQAAREMDGRMAIALMHPDDPRVKIIEAELPNVRKASTKQQLDVQRVEQSKATVGKLKADTQVSEQRAAKIALEMQWMPYEKQAKIASTYAVIENLRSLMTDRVEDNRRGWAALDQQAKISINNNIRQSLDMLRKDETDIRSSIDQTRRLQSFFEVGTPEYDQYEQIIKGEQAKLSSVQAARGEIATQAEEMRDEFTATPERVEELKKQRQGFTQFIQSFGGNEDHMVFGGMVKEAKDKAAELDKRIARLSTVSTTKTNEVKERNKRLDSMSPKQGVSLNGLVPAAMETLYLLDDQLRAMSLKGTITSAKRSQKAQNALAGGKPSNSPHTGGRAIDMVIAGDMRKIAAQLKKAGFNAVFEPKGHKNANGSVSTGDHIHVTLSSK